MAKVSPKARIGSAVTLGEHSVIHDHVVIEDGVTIEDFCVIGKPAGGELAGRELRIGKGSTIRSHAVLYEGSSLGENLSTGHHVLIREGTHAGRNFRLGSFSDVEGHCTVGDFTSCHSYVHIGQGSKIGSFVWLYSQVTLANDPLPVSHIERPATLEDGVVVCLGAIVLPGAVMRLGSYACAGAIVRGEVPEGRVVCGDGGELAGHVSTLIDLDTGTRHPWMNHAYSRYPEQTWDQIKELGARVTATRFRRGAVK